MTFDSDAVKLVKNHGELKPRHQRLISQEQPIRCERVVFIDGTRIASGRLLADDAKLENRRCRKRPIPSPVIPVTC